ncbi:unnamed protein product, partial [Prorocentrum cordatum]
MFVSDVYRPAPPSLGAGPCCEQRASKRVPRRSLGGRSACLFLPLLRLRGPLRRRASSQA